MAGRGRPLRLLLLSAPFGDGHRRVALALQQAFERLDPTTEIQLIDLVPGADATRTLLTRLHVEMLRHAPGLWKALYTFAEGRAQRRLVQRLMCNAGKSTVERALSEHSPDLILSTHPFASAVLAAMTADEHLSKPFVTCVTDFRAHPLWAHPEATAHYVPSPDAQHDVTACGVSPEQVRITGIPICEEFALASPDGKKELAALRRRLGVDPNLPTILVMGGGLGLGPLEHITRSLTAIPDGAPMPWQVVVVSGKNQALRGCLDAAVRGANVPAHVIGFTERIHEWMHSADLLVTKPGGVTCSEALVCGVPMLLVDPIPGQEEANAGFLVGTGAAILVRNPQGVSQEARRLLLEEPTALSAMRHCCRRVGKADAAERIARHVVEMVTASTTF